MNNIMNSETLTTMKKYYADKNSLKFLRVMTFLIISGIIIALNYLLEYLENRFPDYFSLPKVTVPEIIIWAVVILLLTAYVVFLMIILPLWYRSVSYTVSSDEIIIKSGIFVKNTCYIKMSSVQYTTAISMPFAQYTSFNFLIISAYGGRLVCFFLSSSDMAEISRKIQQALSSRGGL